MPSYIDKDKLIRDLIDNRSFYPAIVKSAIENAPVINIDEDYAIQCTCYALGCQQAEQIETKAKQEVAREIFDKVKKRIHNEYTDLSNIVPTDDDYYLGKLAGISEAEIIIAELKKKYIGKDTDVPTNKGD